MTTYELTKPSAWQRLIRRRKVVLHSRDTPRWAAYDADVVTVDLVIPARNEAATLKPNVTRLMEFVHENLTYHTTITIADSGSSDETLAIARSLAQTYKNIRIVSEVKPGRGRVLRTAWSSSSADIVGYLDEDLSTDLSHLPELLEPLIAGRAAVATGSRLHHRSQTKRRMYRELLSRGYVWLLKRTLRLSVSDAQCGFKAIRADAAREVLPLVHDDGWFFDTELLVRAQHLGWRVHEVPVRWIEDTDSRVHIASTVWRDLRGIDRVRAEYGQRSLTELLGLSALLIGTAAFYIINLNINGDANSFYAAAVQAATTSWKAFFYASLDGASFVTVDKPPVAIWVMALFTRAFGFSSFTMLLPDALAGVGTVALVYAAVRRWYGYKSALLAGLVMAITPVAALMFRFNNPDAVLTFFLTLSAYAFVRAVESDKFSWLALSGIATGFAFNTKMLQGLIVLPALAITYLIVAKRRFWARLGRLALAGVVTAVSALWWPVIVWLVPVSNRPYIDNSTNNSIWNLIFGYNGLSRILGRGSGTGGTTHRAVGTAAHAAAGGVGTTGTGTTGAGTAATLHSMTGMAGGFGGGGGMTGRTGFGESTGILRMFNPDFGGNISWFIPLALIGALLGLWLLRRHARTNLQRAGILLWAGWTVLHIIVFSFASGTIHPYYPVVIAPGIAALVGIAVPYLWRAYLARRGLSAWMLPLTLFITGMLSVVLLGRTTTLWLEITGWTVGVVTTGAAAIMAWHLVQPFGQRLLRVTAVAGIVAVLAGPAAYAASTVVIGHTGSIPTAGPTSTAMAGSNNETSQANSALVSYLLSHRDGATWIVAVASANESAPIQLSAGQPVMALGGFSGTDNIVSLAQFKALVKAGKVKYYAVSTGRSGGFGGFVGAATGTMGSDITGGFGGGGFGRSSANSAIESWATSTGTKINYGGTGVTLYELHAS